MPGVGRKTVGDVEHRVRPCGQRSSLGEPERRTHVLSAAEGRPGAAERAGDDEEIAGLSAAAAGDALRAAERGHGEEHVRRGGRVPADHRHSRLGDPLVQVEHGLELGLAWQGRDVTTSALGPAPDAARSLRLTAAARKPSSRHDSQSRRKCTPSTSAS